ncbi:MAG: class I SAM-dependent methyltransferase [bacterium]
MKLRIFIMILALFVHPFIHANNLDSSQKKDQASRKRKSYIAERWNKILTSENPTFNTQPNKFLIEMIKSRKPGKALDVGMGQGRNTIYLSEQGWEVTGFDPAYKAVALAEKHAKQKGLNIKTSIQTSEEFDFGNEQWDLIVLSYVPVRGLIPKLYESLKDRGIIVLEAFHLDATTDMQIGKGVVFKSNELIELFKNFRVLYYEDTNDKSDFGLRYTRIIRLCAQKELN